MSTGKWFNIKKEANEAVRLRDERQQRADIEAKYREATGRVADLEARLAKSIEDCDAYRAEAERAAREIRRLRKENGGRDGAGL